jgi:hypothetical protein
MLFSPIVTLLSIVPVIGKLVAFGIWIICFVTTLVLALCIIIVSWFASRPLMASLLLLVVVAGCALIQRMHS